MFLGVHLTDFFIPPSIIYLDQVSIRIQALVYKRSKDLIQCASKKARQRLELTTSNASPEYGLAPTLFYTIVNRNHGESAKHAGI